MEPEPPVPLHNPADASDSEIDIPSRRGFQRAAATDLADLFPEIRKRLADIDDQMREFLRYLQDDGPRRARDELRQRLIHVELKIDDIGRRVPEQKEFRGTPGQRYGHLTYSQHGEDLVFVALFERLNVEHPTYLDIGANHPIDCSNTALLYRRGSRGVNIDANPNVIPLFETERPEDLNINVGVAGKTGDMTFYRFDPTSGLNSFSREAVEQQMAWSPQLQIHDTIDVPVMTLDLVVEKYCAGNFPDLLSIDAEGLDYEILSATSFDTRPKIICVETHSGAGTNDAEMDGLLTSRDFRKCIQMYANAIYIDEKSENL